MFQLIIYKEQINIYINYKNYIMNSITTFQKTGKYFDTYTSEWRDIPPNIFLVHQDITRSKENIICHQCNSITKKAAFLAEHIFKKYPYANCYRTRLVKDEPGKIIFKDKYE